MNNLIFSPIAWDAYLYWQMQDKKTMRRINQLLKEIQRSPFDGLRKPEPLKYCNGFWSRRIDEKKPIDLFCWRGQGHRDHLLQRALRRLRQHRWDTGRNGFVLHHL